MSDKNAPKHLVRRQRRIRTDDRGRSVWADPVETGELELVSTTTLQKILESIDEKSRKCIEKVARDGDDGVLARDAATGQFEIIDDDELQTILDSDQKLPPISKPTDVTLVPLTDKDVKDAEKLSLVTTQALRKLLDNSEAENVTATDTTEVTDPYNNN